MGRKFDSRQYLSRVNHFDPHLLYKSSIATAACGRGVCGNHGEHEVCALKQATAALSQQPAHIGIERELVDSFRRTRGQTCDTRVRALMQLATLILFPAAAGRSFQAKKLPGKRILSMTIPLSRSGNVHTNRSRGIDAASGIVKLPNL